MLYDMMQHEAFYIICEVFLSKYLTYLIKPLNVNSCLQETQGMEGKLFISLETSQLRKGTVYKVTGPICSTVTVMEKERYTLEKRDITTK